MTRHELDVGLDLFNQTKITGDRDVFARWLEWLINNGELLLGGTVFNLELLEWLDGNTTFYDVDRAAANWSDPNVPVLASASKRIWYHATDDLVNTKFGDLVLSAQLRRHP